MSAIDETASPPEVTKPNDGPGTLETLHNKAHEIFPIPFTGAKLIINKGLSSNFQVNHTFTFATPEQSGYKFGATYVGHNKISESEPYPVFLGEIQPNGNLQAQVIHYINKYARCRYLGQIQNSKMVGQQFATDIKYGSWQSCVTVINPDIEKKVMMSAVDVMRQITPSLSLGTMFFCQCSPQIPSGKDGVWSIGGKYAKDSWTAALNCRPMHLSFHTSFHMQANENLQFGAEFESNLQQQTNVATVGYQYEIPKAALNFKSQIDSNLNVGSTLEKRLLPFPFTLTLSAMSNLATARYEVGIGLLVG